MKNKKQIKINKFTPGYNYYKAILSNITTEDTQDFLVYAKDKKEAIELIGSYIHQKNLVLLYDNLTNNKIDDFITAEEYARVNGLTHCKQSDIYIKINSLQPIVPYFKGLKRASGKTKDLTGWFSPWCIHIFFDTQKEEVIAVTHYDLEHNERTRFYDEDIVDITCTSNPLTQKEIVELIQKVLNKNKEERSEQQ